MNEEKQKIIFSTKLKKIGSSFYLLVPSYLVKTMELKEGEVVLIEIKERFNSKK